MPFAIEGVRWKIDVMWPDFDEKVFSNSYSISFTSK